MTGEDVRSGDAVVIEQLVAVVRRRWKVVAAFVVVAAAMGLAYAEMQAPVYSSSATVMVRTGPSADPLRIGAETSTPEEEGQFLSQLELAKSTSVAARVAQSLDLLNDKDFAQQPLSGPRRLLARLGLSGFGVQPQPTMLDEARLVSRLQDGVKVSRQGRTYIATISYLHSDPAVARAVAQAFAESFRQSLADSNAQAEARIRAAMTTELASASAEAKPALEARFREALAARAVPGVEATIISEARLAAAPILPRRSFIVIVAAIIGAALGAALAGWRELSDRGLRDGDMLARALGTRFFGYLPAMSAYRKKGAVVTSGFSLPADARHAVAEPYSRFAETLRGISVAALAKARDGQAVVLAVTSVLPGEGKTLVTANLAAQLGNQGKKVLLVDGQFRDPDLSDWLSGRRELGLVDSLIAGRPTAETALFDSKCNVVFLPAASHGRTVEPAALLSGAKMAELLATERAVNDVIIIDLPALTSAADGTAIAPLVDGFVLVAEWGGPAPELVKTVVAGEPAISGKLIGLVVTRTRLRHLAKYVDRRSRGAFQYRIG